jgi:hypothetical protein
MVKDKAVEGGSWVCIKSEDGWQPALFKGVKHGSTD